MDDQSFVVVENIFFQTMIKRLNFEAKICSTDTMHNNIMKVYNEEKINIKKQLQEVPGKISFTLDC